jgi:hypothetical protein
MLTIVLDQKTRTGWARSLSRFLRDRFAFELKHSHAVQAIAAMLGLNEHSLAAAIEGESPQTAPSERGVSTSEAAPVPLRFDVPDETSIGIRVHIVDTIDKLVRTSRQMLDEVGREPTPEELAEKLLIPVEKVRAVLKIAQEPISRDEALVELRRTTEALKERRWPPQTWSAHPKCTVEGCAEYAVVEVRLYDIYPFLKHDPIFDELDFTCPYLCFPHLIENESLAVGERRGRGRVTYPHTNQRLAAGFSVYRRLPQ